MIDTHVALARGVDIVMGEYFVPGMDTPANEGCYDLLVEGERESVQKKCLNMWPRALILR